MILLSLIKKPNQSLSVTIDDILWELTIKVANHSMVVDVYRDGEPLVLGQRALADTPLIPYQYLSLAGNFTFLTDDGEMPWWEEFESTHKLAYLAPEELGIKTEVYND